MPLPKSYGLSKGWPIASGQAAGSGGAPANASLPTISGTATEGQTLTATTGGWTNSPTSYTYQWLRSGTPIVGAVNTTRVLASADIGATISVTVTAANDTGSTSATSAATSAVAAASSPVPVNTVAPAVTGTTTLGSLLTTTNGTWSNSPSGYTYQWRRDGVNIGGATASTYTIVADDYGTTITARVTASNVNGSAAANSNDVAVPIPVLTKTVTINNASGASQTDYQVRVPITWATGMRTDFADVRFPDAAGYWIDPASVVDGVSATAWIKLASLAAASTTTTLQYGGGLTVTTGDGNDVFDFFDDFETDTPDPAKWGTSTTSGSWIEHDRWKFTQVIMNKADAQGSYSDGVNVFYGANNGTGVSGQLTKYNWAGTQQWTTTTAPHANSISRRGDNGNILVCSAGDTSTSAADNILVEHSYDTGAKVCTYAFHGVLPGSAKPNGAYHSPGKFVCVTSNTVFVLTLTDNGDLTGTVSIDQSWPINYTWDAVRYQDVQWIDDHISFMVDDPAVTATSYGSIRGFALNAETGEFDYDQDYSFRHLPAGEREGHTKLTSTRWFYSSEAGIVNEIAINPRRQLNITATELTNRIASLVGVSGISGDIIAGFRAAIVGNYPSIGFASAHAGTVGADELIIGHLASADTGLELRPRLAGAGSNIDVPSTTGYTGFKNYEVGRKATGTPTAYVWVDGVLRLTHTTSVPSGALKPLCAVSTASQNNFAQLNCDHYYIRKYQSTEPTVSGG